MRLKICQKPLATDTYQITIHTFAGDSSEYGQVVLTGDLELTLKVIKMFDSARETYLKGERPQLYKELNDFEELTWECWPYSLHFDSQHSPNRLEVHYFNKIGQIFPVEIVR